MARRLDLPSPALAKWTTRDASLGGVAPAIERGDHSRVTSYRRAELIGGHLLSIHNHGRRTLARPSSRSIRPQANKRNSTGRAVARHNANPRPRRAPTNKSQTTATTYCIEFSRHKQKGQAAYPRSDLRELQTLVTVHGHHLRDARRAGGVPIDQRDGQASVDEFPRQRFARLAGGNPRSTREPLRHPANHGQLTGQASRSPQYPTG